MSLRRGSASRWRSNALWLNALESCHASRRPGFANVAEKALSAQTCLKRASDGFARFWNQERGCLYDVLDIDGGRHPRCQHQAQSDFSRFSLPWCVLPAGNTCAPVVDTCARDLLTSHGLRALAPRGSSLLSAAIVGNAWERDAAYHQGTVLELAAGALRPRPLPRLRRCTPGRGEFLAPISAASGFGVHWFGQRSVRW